MKASKKKLNESIRRFLVLALLLPMSLVAWAQNITVSGKVIDQTGEPLLGATVLVKGTTNGAATDFDGNYSISNVAKNATLVFQFIGYTTQEVKVDGRTKIDVTLQDDAVGLEDVVVVGYGIQKKSDVTGALTHVDEKVLQSKPVANPFEALQGKAAGVDITSGSRPGELGSIRIRGNRSLNASNEPLYVVDGVPLNAGGIDALNTNDIESIDILKDASSTAIYGSRGANGVVLITTKRGKDGQFKLNYNGSTTWEGVKDLAPAFSAKDYITWKRWAYYNSNTEKYPMGNAPTMEADKAIFAADPAALGNVMKGWAGSTWNGDAVTDTDWTKFVSQTGFTHQHSLSASGGTDKLQGSASFGYLSNDGTTKGQSYERYNFAASVDVQAKPWFKMGGSINISYADQSYGFSRTGQSSGSGPVDLYAAAKAIPRWLVPYDESGELITNPGGSESNLYTVMDEWKKSNEKRQSFRTLGSFYGQIDFGKIWEPLKGIQYKIAFGPDFRYYRRGIFIDSTSAVKMGSKNYVSRNDSRNFAWTLDNMLMYNRTFGKHNVGVTLLQSATSYNTESSSMSANGIPFPSMLWNNMGVIDITNSDYKAGIGTGLSENQMASYMARVNYSFAEKYLLTVSGRWDGSSVLAEGNKWDFFPSAALGWRMEQEDFMKDIDWLDQLKLRVGLGTTGNSSVSPYGTLGVISTYWMPFSTGNSMILVTNEPYYTNGSNQMPNKSLGWEKTTQYNFGVDFATFRGRLGGTIEVYTSRTKDLLLAQSIPSLSGYPSQMANIGETKNFGTEVTLNAVPVRIGGFEWSTNLNFAYQKDEIVSLANGKQDDITNNWFIGESIGVYYGIKADGLWQDSDAAEMAKFNEKGAKFQVGLTKPVDQNGDYKIDADDRVILGNTNPNFTAGWSNTFSYKGLELTVDLYGRFGYMVSTGGEGQLGMYQQREINYWRPDNTNSDYQKPIYSTSGGDAYSSLLGFKDASFIKLRNLSLGYNFDKKLCRKMGIETLKLYAQGKNLGCIYSSIDFLDLDMGRSYYDRGFTLGVSVGF